MPKPSAPKPTAPKQAPQLQRVNIVLDTSAKKSAVLKQLKSLGFILEADLSETGVLSGSVPGEQVDSISQIAGVAALERERKIQIAPPTSGVQ